VAEERIEEVVEGTVTVLVVCVWYVTVVVGRPARVFFSVRTVVEVHAPPRAALLPLVNSSVSESSLPAALCGRLPRLLAWLLGLLLTWLWVAVLPKSQVELLFNYEGKKLNMYVCYSIHNFIFCHTQINFTGHRRGTVLLHLFFYLFICNFIIIFQKLKIYTIVYIVTDDNKCNN